MTNGAPIIRTLCQILEQENAQLRKGDFSQLDAIRQLKMEATNALEIWLGTVTTRPDRDIITGMRRIDMLSNRNKRLLLASRNSLKSAEASLFALKNIDSDVGTYNRLGKSVRLGSNELMKTKYL